MPSIFPFDRPLNLPLPLLVPGICEVALGLHLLLTTRSPLSAFTPRETIVPAPRTKRIADSTRVFGLAAVALGSNYFLNSYMPLEQNQFVHLSVPVRFALAGVIAAVLGVKGREGLSEEGFWELVGLAVFDGFGAGIAGWYLGRWDGKVAGY